VWEVGGAGRPANSTRQLKVCAVNSVGQYILNNTILQQFKGWVLLHDVYRLSCC